MLGRFFIENQRIEIRRVQRNALTFFKPYRFMINPFPQIARPCSAQQNTTFLNSLLRL